MSDTRWRSSYEIRLLNPKVKGVRRDSTLSVVKQPKFYVIDYLQKVATGRKLL